MSKNVNQTNKKTPDNRSEIKDEKIKNKVYSIWLGRKNGNGTFYFSEYDPNFNIEEVKELLNDKESENAK